MTCSTIAAFALLCYKNKFGEKKRYIMEYKTEFNLIYDIEFKIGLPN